MRLGMLIVGRVHIQREPDGRLIRRLNRRLSLAGGVVSSVPGSTRLEGAGKSALLNFDPTARTRTEGAVLLAEGDSEGASEKFREAYATLASEWNWAVATLLLH